MCSRQYLSTLFLLLSLSLTLAAHLPAVRRVQRPHRDSKRVLASRLIRSADRHKERSLRDVLGEKDAPSVESRDGARRKARKETAKEEEEVEEGGRIRTMSQLFAWAINNTVHSASANYSSALFTDVERDDRPGEGGVGTVELEVELPADWDVKKERVTVGGRQALPGGKKALPSGRGEVRKTRRKVRSAVEKDAEFELLNSATESEFDIIKRNVNMLDKQEASPTKLAKALQVLEELCHSIDNGRDLQISGGLSPLLKALSNQHDVVRANAAWALATCCQNNPTVQNAALELDAVPLLSRLAADDESSAVRSKALFALNAMLELEKARAVFEDLSYAIHAVRNALLDSSDYRATRRALNLTELLVQRNLDVWKTQLEAWDVPMLVEVLMRSHPDIDVRTSAARTIAALDGRPVA